MFIVFIVIFYSADASFSVKCNPGFFSRVFKSSVNYVKARIIFLSLLFFIDIFRMALQSYTYTIYMYSFPLLDVVGKRLHRCE